MPYQEHTKTDLSYMAALIKGQVISVYLKGRLKPMTGCYVCAVYPHLLVCRANGSTHLFPQGNICCIRYSPDAEPARNPNHPLHTAVRQKDGHHFAQEHAPPHGPKSYDTPDEVRTELNHRTGRK